MPDWQQRITRETAPAIRVEHELRYHSIAPLVGGSGTWADLGCGTGLSARAALGQSRPDTVLLVDRDPELVAGATAAPGCPAPGRSPPISPSRPPSKRWRTR
jgi:predicted RNA methylase